MLDIEDALSYNGYIEFQEQDKDMTDEEYEEYCMEEQSYFYLKLCNALKKSINKKMKNIISDIFKLNKIKLNLKENYYTDGITYVDVDLDNVYKKEKNKLILIGKAKDILTKMDYESLENISIKINTGSFSKLHNIFKKEVEDSRYTSHSEFIEYIKNKLSKEIDLEKIDSYLDNCVDLVELIIFMKEEE